MKHKRKKIARMRGTKTHGWGSMKKHRGSGNRGGFGMAGTGKRADQLKPSIAKWYKNEYFGRHGFKRAVKNYKATNIEYISKNLKKFMEQGRIKKEGSSFIINLDSLGFGKLLSKGIPTENLIIHAASASEKAIEKIKSKGGKVILKNEPASQSA